MPPRRLTAIACTAASLAALLLGPATRPVSARDGLPLTDIKRSDLTLVPGKLAEPADDGPHPGSWTEWWYAHVMDPATKRTFIAMLFTAPAPMGLIFWYPEKGQKLIVPALTGEVTATDQPAVRSSVGNLVWDTERETYHLTWNGGFAEADIWFENAVPGVTGGPIEYDGGQKMYWTSPVATSHVKGWLKPPGGKRISVDGWRGYHDHNWGPFNVVDQRYSGWEWGVSHEPDGSATLLGGVVKGDGTWQGVVGRATPSATYGCMAALKLSDWKTHGLFTYPGTTNASCPSSLLATKEGLTGRMPAVDVDFHVVDPVIIDVGLFALPESLGRTTPGSLGLIEHIRTLPPRINP